MIYAGRFISVGQSQDHKPGLLVTGPVKQIVYYILIPQFEFIHKQHDSLQIWFQSYVIVALLWTIYIGLYTLK